MTTEEQDFSSRLASVGHDAVDLLVHTYQGQAFGYVANGDGDIRDAVNQNWGFFSAMLSGHQNATFSALHRLYETKQSNDNLGTLLNCARDHPQLFARAALTRRRCERGMLPAVAAHMEANAFVPEPATFRELKKLLGQTRRLYEQRAENIRHRLFAHTDRAPLAERVALFDGLMLRDLERMAVFPHVMHLALDSLFKDGRQPDVAMPVTNVVDVVNNPPPVGQGHFYHFSVAGVTRGFLQDYTRMMRRDDGE